jgi:hypothetical protein
VAGYVARWTEVKPGSDGDFTIRATHNSGAESGNKAYACDVFLLEETSEIPDPPTTFVPTVPAMSGWGYGALLIAVFGVGAFALRRRQD